MAKKEDNPENPVRREMVATPSEVRSLLDPSDEKVAVLQKEQEKLLRLFRSRARLTPEERRVARGIELERHHRQTGKKDSLAEALASQGRYNEAASVAKNKELRQSLQEKAAAVRSDRENCPCDDYYEAEDGTLLPNQHVESIDAARGKAFIRCRECGKLVHGKLLPHLAALSGARRRSERGEEIRAEEFFQKR